jgi:hypothetical protein
MRKKVVVLSFSFEKDRTSEASLMRASFFFAVSDNYNHIWMDFKEIIKNTF